MRVIATAGHVDHGKSTLVRALTGTDPDRLTEEKRRGLTIDLGFAGMTLPSGERVAFVDVPGHRRFIGNMLAGLGPAPVVMFVVAADQGWQAQSQEHLDAVAALGLTHGLLVLTRCGLASRERIDDVRARAVQELGATRLSAFDVVETDAVTGAGLDELRSALAELVGGLPPVDPDAPVRLWIDRSFSVRGAGTVVTGTLAAGTIRVGDLLDLDRRRVTVRSLQVLGRNETTVGPVSRVAVGLRGIDRDDAPRGALLHSPEAGVRSEMVDVRRIGGHPWGQASPEVSVHVGTASVCAHVRPLDDEHARLTLEKPLPWTLGDRFIVRDHAVGRIHCGAVVLDISPALFDRRGAAIRRATTLSQWEPGDAAPLVADRGAIELDWLRRAGAHGLPSAEAPLNGDGPTTVSGWCVSAEQTTRWLDALRAFVDDDARDPLSRGIPVSVVAARLGAPAVLVPGLVDAAALHLNDGWVAGDEHGASLGAADAGLEALRARLADDPFAAPEADELAALGLGSRQVAAAAQRGQILRLPADPADIVLLPDAPARAMRVLAGLPQPFTTSAARAALGTTRRVVIPLLEHLDARGWTRRDGNTRSVVR